MGKDSYIWVFLHLQRSGGTTFNGHLFKNLKKEEFIHLGLPWLTERERRKIKSFEKRPVSERRKARVITGHKAYFGVHEFVPEKIPRYITILRDPADRLASYYNSRDFEGREIPSFEEWMKPRRKNEMVHFYASKFKGFQDTEKVPSFISKLNHKIRGSEKRIFWTKKILKSVGLFGKPKSENERKELEYAKKILNLCWFIGIVDLDEDIGFLFKSIGMPYKKWERYAFPGDQKTKQINPLHKYTPRRFFLNNKLRKKFYEENSLDVELYKYALQLNKKKKKELKFPKKEIKNIDKLIKKINDLT